MNYRYLSVFFNVYGPSIGHFDVHTHVLHSSHSMSDFDEQSNLRDQTRRMPEQVSQNPKPKATQTKILAWEKE